MYDFNIIYLEVRCAKYIMRVVNCTEKIFLHIIYIYIIIKILSLKNIILLLIILINKAKEQQQRNKKKRTPAEE